MLVGVSREIEGRPSVPSSRVCPKEHVTKHVSETISSHSQRYHRMSSSDPRRTRKEESRRSEERTGRNHHSIKLERFFDSIEISGYPKPNHPPTIRCKRLPRAPKLPFCSRRTSCGHNSKDLAWQSRSSKIPFDP